MEHVKLYILSLENEPISPRPPEDSRLQSLCGRTRHIVAQAEAKPDRAPERRHARRRAMRKIGRNLVMGLPFIAMTWACGETYQVAPDGHDEADGLRAPWRTIQHAVRTVPNGDHIIELAPGTYTEKQSLDFSARKDGALTIQSREKATPAVITSSGDQAVIRFSKGSGGMVTFRDVMITHPTAPVLVRIEAGNVRLAFKKCRLNATSRILEATAEAKDARIVFRESKLKAASKVLVLSTVAEVILKDCELEWEDGPFVQGRAIELVIDGCSLKGSPTTLVLNAGGAGPVMARFEFTNSKGSCGRLLWEQGRIGQLLITGNTIQWGHTGTVTIGAGIEVRNGQELPTVNPAPFDKILIADNIFHFAEDTTHTLFFGKGADGAEVLRNTLIAPKARKYGVVLKSNGTRFESNVIFGGSYAFYLAGGCRNHILNNTIVSDQTRTFVIDANQERSVPPEGTHGQPKDNVVEGNVFVATHAIAFSQDLMGDDDSATWNNAINRNVYWILKPGVLATLNAIPIEREDGVKALREIWAQYGSGSQKMNDSTSLVADPLLANPPDDFLMAEDSPARKLNAGAVAQGTKEEKK